MPTERTHSKLLALAVHELRTPITIVSGYLRMLLSERAGALSDQQRKLLEETERSSSRLASLVADLSDVANLQAGTAVFNHSELPIFPLVDEVAAQLSGDGDRTIEIELRGDPPPAMVVADAHRLRAALTAICSAVLRDLMKADRFVVARSIRTDGDVAFAVLAVGDEASVADLMMMSKRRLATFDEWRSGWGLSLVIARHVIEAHGGRLAAPRGQRAKTGAMMLLPTRRA